MYLSLSFSKDVIKISSVKKLWHIYKLTVAFVRFLVQQHTYITYLFFVWLSLLIICTLNVCLQLLYELKRSRNWASLHVADHSCFHYRSVRPCLLFVVILRDEVFDVLDNSFTINVSIIFQRLMLKILEGQCYKQEISSSGYSVGTYQLWKVHSFFSNYEIISSYGRALSTVNTCVKFLFFRCMWN